MALETQLATVLHACWDAHTNVSVLPIDFKPNRHALASVCFFQREIEIELIISVALRLLILRPTKTLSKELVYDVVKMLSSTKIKVEISAGSPAAEVLILIAASALVCLYRSACRWLR